MIRKLVVTDNDSANNYSPDLVLGVIFFAPRRPEAARVFGGYDSPGTPMGFFTESCTSRPVFAFLAIAAEFFADWSYLRAVHSRGVLGVFCNMIVAIAMGSWSVRVLDELDWGTERGRL